ncbi:hypothetical protein SAMN05660657_03204 [Geodermatophilus amargosae]|uniref:Transposase DDE domain-containing protein n=1 Tax=Geodermatophilus amargosae TaxID=1296565 RepID=A0A1I7B0B8_9ACTN|nr:hypothetical protein [Geodermatophilus amargosae]SFT80629.1 hypothetical protein SAMN05660657_03204 [Geodermatophilus amargosae]
MRSTGQDKRLRVWCEQHGLPYLLATRSTDTVATVDWRQRRVRALIVELPESAWARCSAGAGAHGLRLYDWARLELLAGVDASWSRWVLARRTIPTDPGEESQLAFYVCAGPTDTSLEQLIAVAGSRWRIEECFAAARNEAGLASYQVRDYTAWYRHITLAMLAHAYPSATRASAEKGGPAAGSEQLIALTVLELRRLLNTLIRRPRLDLDHAADWSWWRRRRQAQARAAHYRARGQAPP